MIMSCCVSVQFTFSLLCLILFGGLQNGGSSTVSTLCNVGNVYVRISHVLFHDTAATFYCYPRIAHMTFNFQPKLVLLYRPGMDGRLS